MRSEEREEVVSLGEAHQSLGFLNVLFGGLISDRPRKGLLHERHEKSYLRVLDIFHPVAGFLSERKICGRDEGTISASPDRARPELDPRARLVWVDAGVCQSIRRHEL